MCIRDSLKTPRSEAGDEGDSDEAAAPVVGLPAQKSNRGRRELRARLDAELCEKLQQRANAAGRSLAQELALILQREL